MVAGRVVPLALLALAASSVLPRIEMGSGPEMACVSLPSGLSWLGLHLDLVRENQACASGMVDAAQAVVHANHLVLALCLSTLGLALLGLLNVVGLGVAVRVLLRSARAWLSRHTLVARSTLSVPVSPRAPRLGAPRVPDLRRVASRRALSRRGPPRLLLLG